MSEPKHGVAGGSEGGLHMALDRPAHAPEAADGTTASAAVAPLTSGFAAYGGLAQTFPPPPPSDFWHGLAGGKS